MAKLTPLTPTADGASAQRPGRFNPVYAEIELKLTSDPLNKMISGFGLHQMLLKRRINEIHRILRHAVNTGDYLDSEDLERLETVIRLVIESLMNRFNLSRASAFTCFCLFFYDHRLTTLWVQTIRAEYVVYGDDRIITAITTVKPMSGGVAGLTVNLVNVPLENIALTTMTLESFRYRIKEALAEDKLLASAIAKVQSWHTK